LTPTLTHHGIPMLSTHRCLSIHSYLKSTVSVVLREVKHARPVASNFVSKFEIKVTIRAGFVWTLRVHSISLYRAVVLKSRATNRGPSSRRTGPTGGEMHFSLGMYTLTKEAGVSLPDMSATLTTVTGVRLTACRNSSLRWGISPALCRSKCTKKNSHARTQITSHEGSLARNSSSPPHGTTISYETRQPHHTKHISRMEPISPTTRNSIFTIARLVSSHAREGGSL
jgi:hypothetical protein